MEKKQYDEPGLRSVDCCLQTPVTNFEHCRSDATRLIGCFIGCLLLCTRFVALPILSQNLSAQRFGIAATGAHYHNHYALIKAVDVSFVGVQHGFSQLLPTQTWVKCTSLAVAYFMRRLSGSTVLRIWNSNYFFRVVFPLQ